MIAGGHGDANPNTSWLYSRGMWLAYILGLICVHLTILSIPFCSIAFAWTLTNLLHNMVIIELISTHSKLIEEKCFVGPFVFLTFNKRSSLD